MRYRLDRYREQKCDLAQERKWLIALLVPLVVAMCAFIIGTSLSKPRPVTAPKEGEVYDMRDPVRAGNKYRYDYNLGPLGW